MNDNSENDTGPFFDAFRNFGKSLKLPNVAIEDVVSFHKKNIRALEETTKNASEGAQAIMGQQRKALEEALADITHMVQDARDGGFNKENARDIVADQAEFAKRSFETTIKNATEMGNVVTDVSKNNIAVLKNRVQESIEDIKSSFDQEDDETPIKPG